MRSFIKVFTVLFVPLFIALAITSYFIHGMMVSNAEGELRQEMRNKWVILASQSEHIDLASVQTYERMARITDETSLRLTVVNRQGLVLFDSMVPFDQITQMENHKGRPEIKDAIYYDEGFATRYSSTTRIQMFYFARKLTDDQVLRLAYPATYVESLQKKFTEQAMYAFVVLSIVILILALYFARKISLPVQKLYYIADRVESGKGNIHFPRFKDPSMSKIAGLIYRIYTSMQKKNIELERDQQKLSHIFRCMDQGVLLLDNENNILHANPWMNEEFSIDFVAGTSLYLALYDIHLIRFFNELLEHKSESIQLKLEDSIFDISAKQVENQKLFLIRNVTKRVEYELFKTELTGNISHELKTPLAMIMGYAETLKDTPDMDDETRSRFLGNIYRSSVRLDHLINDIIELHKLESVGDEFTIDTPTDLEEVSQNLALYYADVEGKSLVFNACSDKVNILPEHLQSVLTNLIDNAFKYSVGDVVTASLEYENGALTITIDDMGPQIDKADLVRIFERFYTCSKSRNKQHSGTGLGLSIVKHIAKLYFGNVRVENNDQAGNRFEVLLLEKKLSL